ncbi:hypothetical protein B0T22DRAFT_435960 [Podospora appendiculata]|uniref:P-loop containing nucleoside triphosphate hydrolase protein n=1 Tax=Podospora appendiculata TaxID=314037 RepID=A0AAE1CFJ4_9PEZI|nr:hypothetical protein B0T22DRAFT_435960 [Podospora appendiculata]
MATSNRPIFVATHPRACSTAFERVYGPERLSERYADDDAAREKSGFANTTYRDVTDQLEDRISNNKGTKRVFIKDIIHYLFPPNGQPASIAPSLRDAAAPQPGSAEAHPNGQGGGSQTTEPQNPTVIPTSLLRKFHFTFLIRHPRRAIPSYFRCTVPPLDKVTGFYHFLPSEAGYDELRRMFDFLQREGIIGPRRAQEKEGENASGSADGHDDGGVSITVVDADDLLDKPAEVIEAYCREVGIKYTPDMLRWDDEESRARAVGAFEKWNGFHDDAIGSTYLKPREHGVIVKSEEEEDAEWREKFGEEGQKVIRECVNANVKDYEYLKSFAIKV